MDTITVILVIALAMLYKNMKSKKKAKVPDETGGIQPDSYENFIPEGNYIAPLEISDCNASMFAQPGSRVMTGAFATR